MTDAGLPASPSPNGPVGSPPVEPPEPDPELKAWKEWNAKPSVEPLPGSLRALLKSWLAEADAEDARLAQYGYGGELDGEILDDEVGAGYVRNNERRRCADELEAVLSAAPPQKDEG